MTAEILELKIATDFSLTPGPRKISEGEFSGEEFLARLLRPRFEEAQRRQLILVVDLDGAAGYPTSFLEASFGGLAREFGKDRVSKGIRIVCTDEPYLEQEIKKYIEDADA